MINPRKQAIKNYAACLYNSFQKCKFSLFASKEIKTILKKNALLKDSCKGGRCFILGCGPSLSTVDFSKLQNEFVFTANLLYKNKDFYKLKSNIHVFSDPAFFQNNESSIISDLKTELLSHETKIFIPLYFLKLINDKSFSSAINLYNPILHFNSNLPSSFKLDKYTIQCSSVVFQSIQIAMYMGFKTIYLLGCDCTGILDLLNKALNISSSNYHAYDKDSESNAVVNTVLNRSDWDEIFYGQGNVFFQYQVFNSYAEKNEINIFNLSSTTILKSIKRKRFEEVIQ